MDPFYRYKVPAPVLRREGRGNGAKTVIVNLSEIAKSLNREPDYIIRFISYEIGVSSQYKRPYYSLNGSHRYELLSSQLNKFVSRFVSCATCGNPETVFFARKKSLRICCKSCGCSSILSVDDHKLVKYILKNK